ncbi:MAG: hypothetical protein Ct9H300mP30_3060 [Methanobacteriota archaeon]|nr:MAG: hypothetical protein Ct9H300mP30_3060 [Euryarchaeota archaeon]
MSEYDRDDKPGTDGDSEMIIDTKGVKVNFGDFWALKGIDISVKKGEISSSSARQVRASRLTSGRSIACSRTVAVQL